MSKRLPDGALIKRAGFQTDPNTYLIVTAVFHNVKHKHVTERFFIIRTKGTVLLFFIIMVAVRCQILSKTYWIWGDNINIFCENKCKSELHVDSRYLIKFIRYNIVALLIAAAGCSVGIFKAHQQKPTVRRGGRRFASLCSLKYSNSIIHSGHWWKGTY